MQASCMQAQVQNIDTTRCRRKEARVNEKIKQPLNKDDGGIDWLCALVPPSLVADPDSGLFWRAEKRTGRRGRKRKTKRRKEEAYKAQKPTWGS